jgi:hypothetical protein
VFFNLKVRNFAVGIFAFDFKGLLSMDRTVIVVCEGWGRERAILKGPPSGTVGVSLQLGGKRKTPESSLSAPVWGPPPQPDLREYIRRVTLQDITGN